MLPRLAFNPTKSSQALVIPVGFMFMQCQEGTEDQIIQRIRSISGVSYVHKVDKSYDIVVKIESESFEQFTAAIASIRLTPGLLNSDTMIGFKR